MGKVSFSLLRGICQMPAYVAYEKGFFKDEGIDAALSIEPTAWMVPYKLMSGESQFAVIHGQGWRQLKRKTSLLC